MPQFDQAFAALITRPGPAQAARHRRWSWCRSEFGRTPKINKDAGRDHWPKVFSVVLAGGGIKKGLIYGTSDATAGEPDSDPLGWKTWRRRFTTSSASTRTSG